MEQGPLGLNPELRTPPLPATHVRAGTGHRVRARNYTTDQGRPSYLRVHSPCATSCRNFLLVSTLITGFDASMCAWAWSLRYPNCASRSGCWPPSVLGVGLQAVAQLPQQPPDHEVADPVTVLGQRQDHRG